MLKNKNGWFMQTYELYPALGIEHGKLPPEGFGPREVQGVTFVCLQAPEPGPRKSSKHRLFYHCDVCDRLVPFGRAAQHNGGRGHKENKL